MKSQLSDDVKRYASERYDYLFSFKNMGTFRITRKINLEIEQKFGEKVLLSPQYISKLLPGGTLLHDFFNYAVDEFKRHNPKIDKKNPARLIGKISSFIEDNYGQSCKGESLSVHEKSVLHNILEKREDVAFVKEGNAHFGGRHNGKLGYFKD